MLPIATALIAAEQRAPQIVGTFPENEADVVRLPDDTLKVFYNHRNEFVGSLTSKDNGKTWSEPVKEFDVAGDTAHAIQVLLDRRGELQVFYLIIHGEGRKLGVDRFLDLWRCSTIEGRTKWSPPKLAFHGAVGALRGIVQMKNGRIVVPFSTGDPNQKPGSPVGTFCTTAVYSDDDGETWQLSPAHLTSPCTEGYNGGNYGAVEPTVVQLSDGRLWSLIRTQTGRMYESFSPDGAEWSPALPSRFYASNSPAMFRRLDDGRLLVVWNNTQVGPKHEGQGVYSGRDGLHAALSDDDGKSWRGFREVYRDPTRHEGPNLKNDRGTAYPDAVQAADGAIVLVTGQGEGRRAIVRFTVDWLLATRREDDFSRGLEGWHAFQEIGPAQRFWRERRLGALLVEHPDDSTRKVLSIGRRDAEPGAGAVWNFPAGRKGTLTLLLRTTPEFRGASVSLADHMIHPGDPAVAKDSQFTLPLAAGERLKPDAWHELKLIWDLSKKECRVRLDGTELKTLTLQGDVESFGPSYLVLLSTAEASDPRGLLIERVAVDVAPTADGRAVAPSPYRKMQMLGWDVRISERLFAEQPQPLEQALELLAAQLQQIMKVVPAGPLAELKKVPLWLSPEYPGTGPKAEYHPGVGWLREHGRNPEMVKGVEFTNILIFEKEVKRMPVFVLHELAHAYHDRVLSFNDPEIRKLYEQAVASKSYDAVKLNNGRTLKAYAMTNDHEYFAELSEAFFGENDFYPFNRDDVQKHDPEMYRLLAERWKVEVSSSDGY